MLHLDYETKSDLSLPHVGLWAYARHTSTSVRCLAFSINDEDKVYRWWPSLGKTNVVLEKLKDLWGSHIVAAWNAAFEYAISKRCMKLGPPKGWLDVQAVARHVTYGASLESAADALKVEHRKDKDGSRLIKKFCGPKAAPDSDPDFRKLVSYCVQDVRAERDVLYALPIKTLSKSEQRMWETDLAINETGVRINLAMVKGAMHIMAATKPITAKTLSKYTSGKIDSPFQRDRIKLWCKRARYIMPNMQKLTVSEAIADEHCPPKVKKLLKMVNDVNVASVAKFLAMARSVSGDRICGVHKFNGADTHRWGGQITQFQNIPRPKTDYGSEIHSLIASGSSQLLQSWGPVLLVLRDCLRNAIIASHGNSLIIADKASIEARVLGWLSGCHGYLEAYRDGLDLYKIMASKIFNTPYEKITDTQRFLGKESILGLGYSMSNGCPNYTFESNCYAKGARMPRGLYDRAVKTYRKEFAEIPKLWYAVEAAAVRCIRSKTPQTVKRIKMEMVTGPKAEYFTMTLPSGNKLWYPEAKVRVTQSKWGPRESIGFKTDFNGHWLNWTTYGGRLVENAVQAIARDLLARALKWLYAREHNPVMHVHDEIVCDSNTPNRTKKAMEYIFTKAPRWAKGLPLDCKVFVSPYYKK